MMDAKQARFVASPKRSELKASVEALKASIDSAVTKASLAQSHSTSVVVPSGFDPYTFSQVQVGLRKMGYTVKVALREGTFAPNLYVEPKVVLSLFW